ncbi:unnamed protein product, partial [Polarella glacialis]
VGALLCVLAAAYSLPSSSSWASGVRSCSPCGLQATGKGGRNQSPAELEDSLAISATSSSSSSSESPSAARPKLGRSEAVRQRLPLLGSALLACACGLCVGGRSASAEVQLTTPSKDKLLLFDKPRNLKNDDKEARKMGYQMVSYEVAVADRKKILFQRLFSALPAKGATVVEVGIGSFPNAPYFNRARGMELVGVDPNDRMGYYAAQAAQREGLLNPRKQNSFRIVHGVAEALPLPSQCADAVICTQTLCTVTDPDQSVAEMRRILKPGGQLLFHEHVLSETDPELAERQRYSTPNNVITSGGCHLDRRTLLTLRAGGFQSVDAESFYVPTDSYPVPTIDGIAIA